MKGIILLIFVLHSALSRPNELNSTQVPPISTEPNKTDGKVNYEIDLDNGTVMYESDLNDHSYSYRYETADGTIIYESGRFEDGNLIVEGGYEYIGENGLVYNVTYIADKNGYRPKVSIGVKASPRMTSSSSMASIPHITSRRSSTTLKYTSPPTKTVANTIASTTFTPTMLSTQKTSPTTVTPKLIPTQPTRTTKITTKMMQKNVTLHSDIKRSLLMSGVNTTTTSSSNDI